MPQTLDCLEISQVTHTAETYRPLGYERVYLPLCKAADTPFYIQGNDIYIYMFTSMIVRLTTPISIGNMYVASGTSILLNHSMPSLPSSGQ